MVTQERLTEPRITIVRLLAKLRRFSNLPAFLDLNDTIKDLILSQINIDSARYCSGHAEGLRATGTCTVVKFLKGGETVNVTYYKRSDGSFVDKGGLNANKHTAFLGYKIN